MIQSYMHQSAKHAEKDMQESLVKCWKLPSRAENPFAIGDSTELDDTPELDHLLSSYYQSQIDILRWMVELGRIDVMAEVSMLASQLALPQEGIWRPCFISMPTCSRSTIQGLHLIQPTLQLKST